MRLHAFLIGCVLLSSGAYAKIPSKLLPIEAEKTAMLQEAEDFIDEISDGRQDRYANAVLHAMRGQTAELVAIRNARKTVPVFSKNVKVDDIVGDGAARGMAMRLYRPAGKQNAPIPLLVYFHGGGWTWGGIESCAAFCDALAATGKVMVLAVDYSLAPEKPFPAGLMDCVAAVEFAFSNAKKWGSSASLVSAGGDSAGGNLAVATSLYLDESHTVKEKLRSLVLLYPVVRAYPDKGSASWKTYSRGYGLDKRLMETFIEAYLSKADKTDPLLSPADAPESKISQMPPVLMISAERDILRDQGAIFAKRLRNADRVELPGAVHLFITVPGQKTAFNKSVRLVSAYLSE